MGSKEDGSGVNVAVGSGDGVGVDVGSDVRVGVGEGVVVGVGSTVSVGVEVDVIGGDVDVGATVGRGVGGVPQPLKSPAMTSRDNRIVHGERLIIPIRFLSLDAFIWSL